jgi:hypothetical protein
MFYFTEKDTIMVTATTGVELQKDEQGNLPHVSIDVRQHGEVIDALKGLGLLQEEAEEGHTVEESKAHVYEVIRRFYENNQ